jgi:outer membrane protein assembly factor BamD
VDRGRTGNAINRIRILRQVSKFMSAPRMTLEQRNPSVDAGRSGRVLRLAAGLIVLAMPLAGCGTGSLWDKFLAKDDTFV